MKKRKKLREIVTPWGCHGDIASEVGCHINSVKDALRGKRNSVMGLRIRELAMRKYGGAYKGKMRDV